MKAPPLLNATEIGEFIRYNSCERRFKLGFNKRELARRLPFAERLFNSLDPVLQKVGHEREAEWERSLRDGEGFEDLSHYSSRSPGNRGMPWAELMQQLEELPVGRSAYAREVEVAGDIGAFRVQGRIDFIVVQWKGGHPFLRLVECKASRKDRTYHRVQVALYQLIVAQLVSENGLLIGGIQIGTDDIQCVVARIDESTNEGQAILELDPLNLDVIIEDIDRLLSSEGTLSRILDADLDELPYKIEPKCDTCLFDVDCLPESARLRKLELLGLDPSDVRVLRSNGIFHIDELASIDLSGEQASRIRAASGFFSNLELLSAKAKARCSTLPRGESDPDEYQVQQLPNRWESQLPSHCIDGQNLVRIYLCVDYDYTENRIGALSAHVTKSKRLLYTGFEKIDNSWRPTPSIVEHLPKENGASATEHPVEGSEVIRFKTSPWTGLVSDDNAIERELIQSFLHDLIDAIAQTAQVANAPIHFYVWSRSEMRQLVEGCTRGGSQLLSHLNELLGCRESLEQLIYSCLGEEVDNRFALGWTGRGLAVVSSLKWYGRSYHWKRTIGGEAVDLDRVFTQDIFDFKTQLHIDGKWQWAEAGLPGVMRHRFEIRSRFHDSLPAPYWHAVWKTLPDPNHADLQPNLRHAIERYMQAALPLRLREYLRARTHALRWVEEGISKKNDDISKPALDISKLSQFELGIDNVSKAALDFLQLEQHMRMAKWVSAHLVAPEYRVLSGQSIPLRNIRAVEENRLEAMIHLDGYPVTLEELEARSSFAEGSFVRLTPCVNSDVSKPQTVGQLFRGGSTCVVDVIDWHTGKVSLSVIPLFKADHYRLLSISREAGIQVFEYATIDESPSDYVAARVGSRLREAPDCVAYRWFDSVAPRLPEAAKVPEDQADRLSRLLERVQIGGDRHLSGDQRRAVLEGLGTIVQLLQGPPGTGKTQTTAIAVLARILNSLNTGNIVLIAANTHTAVDNLLQRIVEIKDEFTEAACAENFDLSPVNVCKVHSSEGEETLDGPIKNIFANKCARDVQAVRNGSIAILGGTTSALIKMASKLSCSARFRNGFQADLLIIDEASMMVFPHFLALATFMHENARIMLSGDHRQLAPILAHEWEREDRPPVVLYQPFSSAYDAVRALADHPAVTVRSVLRSALEYTFRLPPVVRSLIAQLYRLDAIELQGPFQESRPSQKQTTGSWGDVWIGPGLILVTHSERESRKSNPLEAEIISNILASAEELEEDSVAIVTPHRAQRTLLQRKLDSYRKAVPIIDTVERLQGGQRPTVILSATASDPVAIASNVEFILDLNRSNVAFSRVQQRLIVVCAASLLDHIAPELEHYESAMLWKSLRSLCDCKMFTLNIDGHWVAAYAPGQEALENISQELLQGTEG